MSLSNVCNSYFCEDFDNIKQDPLERLPDELVLKIFSYLDFNTLGRICLVSKKWKQIASDETLWKKVEVYDKAVSNKKWAQWFGESVVKGENLEEEWKSLPWNIAGILEGRCPVFPDKRVKDTHMLVRLPKTLNGKLTLKSLGELAKQHFPANNTGYRFVTTGVAEMVDDSIPKSQWVLMTTDILPESIDKTYKEQNKIIADLAKKSLISYEIPGRLEAVACILSKYFDSNICSFNSWTYTRRKRDVLYVLGGVVGSFDQDGLCVNVDNLVSRSSVGVAAIRKF